MQIAINFVSPEDQTLSASADVVNCQAALAPDPTLPFSLYHSLLGLVTSLVTSLSAVHQLGAALVVCFVIYSQIATGSPHVDIFIAFGLFPNICRSLLN